METVVMPTAKKESVVLVQVVHMRVGHSSITVGWAIMAAEL